MNKLTIRNQLSVRPWGNNQLFSLIKEYQVFLEILQIQEDKAIVWNIVLTVSNYYREGYQQPFVKNIIIQEVVLCKTLNKMNFEELYKNKVLDQIFKN